jgi:hypothetical protein
MTIEEASHYVALQKGEELQEAYTRQLFFFKTFFLSSKIIYSLFHQKLIKLNKVEEAFDIMGIKVPSIDFLHNRQFVQSDFMVDAYNSYQQVKSEIFRNIHQVDSFQELGKRVRVLLNINSDFIALWVETNVNAETIKLTDEPDPVEFLDALYKASALGIKSFSEFKEIVKGESADTNDLPDLLLKESMRLYLLAKKELEWKKRLID